MARVGSPGTSRKGPAQGGCHRVATRPRPAEWLANPAGCQLRAARHGSPGSRACRVSGTVGFDQAGSLPRGSCAACVTTRAAGAWLAPARRAVPGLRPVTPAVAPCEPGAAPDSAPVSPQERQSTGATAQVGNASSGRRGPSAATQDRRPDDGWRSPTSARRACRRRCRGRRWR